MSWFHMTLLKLAFSFESSKGKIGNLYTNVNSGVYAFLQAGVKARYTVTIRTAENIKIKKEEFLDKLKKLQGKKKKNREPVVRKQEQENDGKSQFQLSQLFMCPDVLKLTRKPSEIIGEFHVRNLGVRSTNEQSPDWKNLEKKKVPSAFMFKTQETSTKDATKKSDSVVFSPSERRNQGKYLLRTSSTRVSKGGLITGSKSYLMFQSPENSHKKARNSISPTDFQENFHSRATTVQRGLQKQRKGLLIKSRKAQRTKNQNQEKPNGQLIKGNHSALFSSFPPGNWKIAADPSS